MPSLFEPVQAGDLHLANRIAMAPLTRNRAPDAIPTPLMATYYTQRASAGLLITEATAISPQGQGYADVPGLYGTEQLDGWKRVTSAVHAEGGKIVVQLWHVGRVSHTSLQPAGGAPVAPSALTAEAKTYLVDAATGAGSFAATSAPRALLAQELPGIVADFAQNVNTVMVPLLAWIRQYQPELMMNSDKRENAMRFEVEIQNNETCDIEIKLPLTERVKVWKDEQGLHFEHLPEPPEDPYDGITWELFINGEHQPWPPTPSSN